MSVYSPVKSVFEESKVSCPYNHTNYLKRNIYESNEISINKCSIHIKGELPLNISSETVDFFNTPPRSLIGTCVPLTKV